MSVNTGVATGIHHGLGEILPPALQASLKVLFLSGLPKPLLQTGQTALSAYTACCMLPTFFPVMP